MIIWNCENLVQACLDPIHRECLWHVGLVSCEADLEHGACLYTCLLILQLAFTVFDLPFDVWLDLFAYMHPFHLSMTSSKKKKKRKKRKKEETIAFHLCEFSTHRYPNIVRFLSLSWKHIFSVQESEVYFFQEFASKNTSFLINFSRICFPAIYTHKSSSWWNRNESLTFIIKRHLKFERTVNIDF